MLRYLHSLGALLFYILGSLFFVFYVLLINNITAELSAQFLLVGQLPLLASALLYGGLSVYRSLADDDKPSLPIAILIATPLALIFALALFIRLG